MYEFEHFPQEILCKIASYLPPISILHLSKTCSNFSFLKEDKLLFLEVIEKTLPTSCFHLLDWNKRFLFYRSFNDLYSVNSMEDIINTFPQFKDTIFQIQGDSTLPEEQVLLKLLTSQTFFSPSADLETTKDEDERLTNIALLHTLFYFEEGPARKLEEQLANLSHWGYKYLAKYVKRLVLSDDITTKIAARVFLRWASIRAFHDFDSSLHFDLLDNIPELLEECVTRNDSATCDVIMGVLLNHACAANFNAEKKKSTQACVKTVSLVKRICNIIAEKLIPNLGGSDLISFRMKCKSASCLSRVCDLSSWYGTICFPTILKYASKQFLFSEIDFYINCDSKCVRPPEHYSWISKDILQIDWNFNPNNFLAFVYILDHDWTLCMPVLSRFFETQTKPEELLWGMETLKKWWTYNEESGQSFLFKDAKIFSVALQSYQKNIVNRNVDPSYQCIFKSTIDYLIEKSKAFDAAVPNFLNNSS